ncbi:MAG: hypothetical protein JSS04_06135 [Proteobacteria bacterium]|nr:hypothetical protein [Pseudomonadota bacterium]
MVPHALVLPAVLLALATSAWAQVKCGEDLPPVDRDAQTRMTAQDFVRALSVKEGAFAKALGNYGYTVDATVETLVGDTVDGEYHQVSILSFDASGLRREPILTTVNTLKRIKFTDRDVEVLRDALTLTPDRVSSGDVVYSGRQKVGDINAVLFDVLPRNPTAEIRGFEGRAWVWAREDAVMRLCGRSSATPIAPMRFEVIRALVDDRYWFPISIRADEEAEVGKGQKVHVRVTVVYSNYRSR